MSLTNLPLRSFGGSSTPMRPSVSVGANRAQNFHVSKINQKIEREQSAVSMSQVLERKAGHENSHATSISHVGQVTTGPSTSITHAGAPRPGAVGEQNDAGADDRRYDYMRRMIRERQANAAVEAKKAAAGNKGIQVGTGSGLRTTGVESVHKVLGKEFRGNRSVYGGLSGSEKKILEKTITSHLGSKATGSSINRYDRKAMKSDISKAHGSGATSLTHAKMLKKIVDKLG